MMKASRARHNPSASGDPTATATVDSLSYDGRGVARLEGKTVFIEGALPGERVRFRYLNRRKSYDNGMLVEILEASPDRVTPPCPHFGSCGGCGLQHLRSEVQIHSKQQILAEQLTHIGRVQPQTWLDPVTGPALGYRRRARLGVWQVPETGKVSIGFRARRENYLVDLNTCVVLEPKIAGLLPELHWLVDDLSCPNRIPQIETATGDNISALIFRHLVPLVERDREILRAFGERHAIQIYLQGGGPDTITALWPAEPEELLYRLPEFDVEIRFRPTDFVQVNSAINRQMVSQAIQLLDLKDDDQVLDLFCGLGNFTLALARRAKKVLGLEADVTLIEGARCNARRNAIDNVEFRVADLYRENSLATCKDYAANKWLLDPPRGGAMEVIKQLTAPLPSRIVYVSCYPATLARDSDYLVHTLGYRLAAAGVMDMFPQTSHVESMALFDRP
ncbi:MAG: 23S rRNA (uracil(1939)-C(5))-methyltransferase RlmD [Sulfuricaulis sp.]|nr:23S rRNA (uracil(1939)-C(5))-methyltransferase RlmD [Sulfuricaulis sp.]